MNQKKDFRKGQQAGTNYMATRRTTISKRN